VLLVVAARKRRAVGAAPAEAKEPKAAKVRKRDRVKQPSQPRRKRRKLAAEAAHAMGVDQTMGADHTYVIPEVPTPAAAEVAVEAVPVAAAPIDVPAADVTADEAPEPVSAVPVEVVVPVVPTDDPYVQDGLSDDTVFAQPGWPAPGELASSFDPDAFDPLPEAYGPLKEDPVMGPATSDPDLDPDPDVTSAMELPEFSTANEVAALEELQEWAETLDAGEDWSELEIDTAGDSSWTISRDEPAVEIAAMAEAPAEDMETIWSEPDEEPLWSATDTADDAVTEIPVVAQAEETVTFGAPEAAWADDSPNSWQSDDYDAPAGIDAPAIAQTYELPDRPEVPAIAAHEQIQVPAWSNPIGGSNSPVVLDLAGLAASGHSLELVIEPSADGHGVRLRFGAPGTAPVEVPVTVEDGGPETSPADVPVDVVETWDDVVISPPDAADVPEGVDPADATIDVSFLAGVAPEYVDAPTLPIELAAEATASLMDVALPVPQDTVFDAPVIAPETVDEVRDALTADDEPYVTEQASNGQMVAAGGMDSDDDPARILADIRARLAALDARR
jgi:hypothetical protein